MEDGCSKSSVLPSFTSLSRSLLVLRLMISNFLGFCWRLGFSVSKMTGSFVVDEVGANVGKNGMGVVVSRVTSSDNRLSETVGRNTVETSELTSSSSSSSL